MSAEGDVRVVDLLHPETLSKEVLIALFRKRRIPCFPSQSLDDLVKIFYRTLLPLPQRKSKHLKDSGGFINNVKVISLSKRKSVFSSHGSNKHKEKDETVSTIAKEGNSSNTIELSRTSLKNSTSIDNHASEASSGQSETKNETKSKTISLNSNKRVHGNDSKTEEFHKKSKHPRITWP